MALKPASTFQESLWFLSQSASAAASMNMPLCYELSNPREARDVRSAIIALVGKHECLRTSFRQDDSGIWRVVHEDVSVDMEVVSLSRLDASAAHDALKMVGDSCATHVFDLATAPLLHCRFVTSADGAQFLFLTLHHIIADGLSLAVIETELSEYLSGGRLIGPPENAYDRFVEHQRRYLQSTTFKYDLRQSVVALGHMPTIVDFPTRKAPPIDGIAVGHRTLIDIGNATAKQVALFAAQHSVTAFLVYLAAYCALIYRYTGQPAYIVGVPVDLRRDDEAYRSAVGLYVNLIPVPVTIGPGMSVLEFLTEIRRNFLDRFEYAEVPFEELVKELNPIRGDGRHPLCQIVFDWDAGGALNVTTDPLLQPRSLGVDTVASRFDVHMFLRQTRSGLDGHVVYKEHIFSRAGADRFVRHFTAILSEIVRQPHRPIDKIQMLSKQELDELDSRSSDYVRLAAANNALYRHVPETIVKRFETLVAKDPEAIALVDTQSSVTYAELNSWSNALAAQLIKSGTKPRGIVPIFINRSFALVASMLAVLKCGCAYLPIHKDEGLERQRHMVTQCKCSIALGDIPKELQQHCPSSIPLDSVLLCRQQVADDYAESTIMPSDLVCINYTSGSTGYPKGVAISHANVLSLIGPSCFIKPSPGEVYLNSSSPAFDASIFEIWGALLTGSTCFIHMDDLLLPSQLVNYAAEFGVTTAWFTTSLFNLLVDEDLSSLSGLRRVYFGGEAASDSHARRAALGLPHVKFANCYGPTEATTFATAMELSRQWSKGRGPVTLGRPIANRIVYILDGADNHVPVGVPGTLYIAGEGVAMGYLADECATAAVFRQDPFDESRTRRMYRTGDQARYLENGEIEFLGRDDDQFKIRGHRVQLREVERAVADTHGVRTAAIIAARDKQQASELVAYVVLDESASVTIAEIRAKLGARLPPYMVPTRTYAVSELPMTVTGKVDRAGLEALVVRPTPPSDSTSDNATVRTIQAIWIELLGREVGTQDDFFESGGHSLLAIRLMSRLRKELSVNVSSRLIYKVRTINELARLIELSERNGMSDR
ncbi:non-ribosomal peptide synthetase [Notoacmeibacter marinus]|uniref:non-ribosomal peptide synthetase n=1 Tax=Notoacmeibacter marinus TaxID=1876515 RepID=UPI000DF1D7CF|nr:non-ribosomal peptide synthetase [Notoacmeibacter marinus]